MLIREKSCFRDVITFSFLGILLVALGSVNVRAVNTTSVSSHPNQTFNLHNASFSPINSTQGLNGPVNVGLNNHTGGRHISTPKGNASSAETGNVPGAESLEIPSSTPGQRWRKPPDSDNIIINVAQSKHPELRTGKFNPTFAAIVAAICITTAVGGYIMIMTWRRVEMERYGNRQMLINEDDFGDIQDEDMRHFEASCIQIEE